ncbi:hypothetical protein GOV11_05180 [Candidatus Woesearchaeota archaeon]|nr:hypothetical protein [Candidatus Woesearchaeota archaeon]
MKLFGKIDKIYSVGLRFVVLDGFDRLPDKRAILARDIIIDYCANATLPKKFFRLRFFVDPGGPIAIGSELPPCAWVGINSVYSEDKWTVHFDTGYIDGTNENAHDKPGSLPIPQVIDHELTHLLHERKSKKLKNMNKKLDRLEKHPSTYAIGKRGALSYWRNRLAIFIYNIQLEGLADYISNLNADKLIFDYSCWKEIHRRAESASKSVNKAWQYMLRTAEDDSSEARELEDILKHDAYIIGLHVVFTLVLTGTDEEDILNWSDLKMIKTYEKACDKMKIIPVISISSRGIVSYKNMVADLKKKYNSQ